MYTRAEQTSLRYAFATDGSALLAGLLPCSSASFGVEGSTSFFFYLTYPNTKLHTSWANIPLVCFRNRRFCSARGRFLQVRLSIRREGISLFLSFLSTPTSTIYTQTNPELTKKLSGLLYKQTALLCSLEVLPSSSVSFGVKGIVYLFSFSFTLCILTPKLYPSWANIPPVRFCNRRLCSARGRFLQVRLSILRLKVSPLLFLFLFTLCIPIPDYTQAERTSMLYKQTALLCSREVPPSSSAYFGVEGFSSFVSFSLYFMYTNTRLYPSWANIYAL